MTALLLQTLTTVFFHGVTLCIEDGKVELEFALPAECCLRVVDDSTELTLHAEECECTDHSLTYPALDKKPETVAADFVSAILPRFANASHPPLMSAPAVAPEYVTSRVRDRRTVVLQV